MRQISINSCRPNELVMLAAAVLAAGLLALVAAKPAWAESRTFAPAEHYSVGLTPTTVTNADFNGDGNMDLAAQNSGSDTVSVLLGNGDGTYQTKTDYTVGTGPSAVTSADFNGDDKEDLAVSNWFSNNVSVLLGNGDGTFQTANNVAAGTNPSSVTSADFNGDTITDLAVANYRDVNGYGSVSVLLGRGDGTFHPKTDFLIYQQTCSDFLCTSNTAGPNQIIVADFNRDNKADLATANGGGCNPIGFCAPGGVSVLLGNGNGTFQTARLVKSNTTIYSIDSNNSGDIVAAEYDFHRVSMLKSNGDGTFSTGPSFPVGTNPSAVTSTDLNGDSVADLAVSNFNSDNVSVLWGNGSSSFQAAQNYPVGDGPIFVIGAKLNADNFADLAVANQNSSNVSVLLNTAPPPDTTKPTVSLTAPDNGATVRGNLTLSASASDNVGVTKVEFLVDGQVAATDTAAPYSTSWNSATVSDGNKTIQAKAYDAANNETVSSSLTVTVDNTAPEKVTDLSATPGDAKVDLSWTNPTASDLDKVRVLRSTSVAATSPTPGSGQTQVYEGTATSYSDTGLTNSTKYYYTVFASDKAGNWSSAASTSATTTSPPPPDTTRPTVDEASLNPSKLQTGVLRNTDITAGFSEEMNPNTLTTSNVKMKVGRKKVPVEISCDDPCRTVTLDPYPNTEPPKLLAANKKYKVIITTGVKDKAGNALAQNKVWTFTTGSS